MGISPRQRDASTDSEVPRDAIRTGSMACEENETCALIVSYTQHHNALYGPGFGVQISRSD